MKIYIAVFDDRSSESILVRPHTTAAAAIRCAKDGAAEVVAGIRSRFEVKELPLDGFLYHAVYAQDGSRVFVVAQEMDKS